MNTYHDVYRAPRRGESGVQLVVSWRAVTYARLCWAHGENRAYAIINGRDHATNADISAWNRLGRRSAA